MANGNLRRCRPANMWVPGTCSMYSRSIMYYLVDLSVLGNQEVSDIAKTLHPSGHRYMYSPAGLK